MAVYSHALMSKTTKPAGRKQKMNALCPPMFVFLKLSAKFLSMDAYNYQATLKRIWNDALSCVKDGELTKWIY